MTPEVLAILAKIKAERVVLDVVNEEFITCFKAELANFIKEKDSDFEFNEEFYETFFWSVLTDCTFKGTSVRSDRFIFVDAKDKQFRFKLNEIEAVLKLAAEVEHINNRKTKPLIDVRNITLRKFLGKYSKEAVELALLPDFAEDLESLALRSHLKVKELFTAGIDFLSPEYLITRESRFKEAVVTVKNNKAHSGDSLTFFERKHYDPVRR